VCTYTCARTRVPLSRTLDTRTHERTHSHGFAPVLLISLSLSVHRGFSKATYAYTL